MPKNQKRKPIHGGVEAAKAYTAARKESKRNGKHTGRRGLPVQDTEKSDFLKAQARDRWPDEYTVSKAIMLAEDDRKKSRNKRNRPSPKRKPVNPMPMPLLEAALAHGSETVGKLLTAACLKMKRVKRHPGWVLQKTYALKNRPIEIV